MWVRSRRSCAGMWGWKVSPFGLDSFLHLLNSSLYLGKRCNSFNAFQNLSEIDSYCPVSEDLYTVVDSEQTLRSCHIWSSVSTSNCNLFSALLTICRSGVLTALFGCYMADTTWNRCRLGSRSVYTMQPCTSLQCHFIRSRIPRVHVCLAVG